jgi:hypothetical protein
MSDYIKAFLVAPITGPIMGLLIVILYSQKLPDPYYALTFIGLGAILSYLVMTVVGVPIIYLLLKSQIYSLTTLLICSILIAISLTFYYLMNQDASLDLWLFVGGVLLVSSVSVCITFWLLAKK